MRATRKRTPRGRAAVAAWPERLAAVREDPSDANLQSLCTLVDAIDAWVVEGWNGKDFRERWATLQQCRAEAREANRLVTERTRQGQAAAGRVNLASRRQEGRTTAQERRS